MADQKTTDLLWNCALKLTDQSHTERILKSYYITTCRKLARNSVQLPEDSFGTARMCSRCGNQWADGRYQLQLQPQKLRQRANHRRLIAQLETVKAKQLRGEMSYGARKRANWLKKRMASQMAVDCDFCRHKTMLPLEKGQKRAKLKATEETMPAKEPAAASKSKKKAKKNKSQAPNKDINAGLKIPQQQKTAQQQQHLGKSPAPSKKASQPVGIASQNPSQQSKNKKKKPAQPTPAAAKTQSKTQKQNALLQLAAQLKANAFKDASKSQQNRLQAFLK